MVEGGGEGGGDGDGAAEGGGQGLEEVDLGVDGRLLLEEGAAEFGWLGRCVCPVFGGCKQDHFFEGGVYVANVLSFSLLFFFLRHVNRLKHRRLLVDVCRDLGEGVRYRDGSLRGCFG